MIRAALYGSPPSAIRRLLKKSNVIIGPDPAVVLLWTDSPDPDEIASLAGNQPLFVFVESGEHALLAANAGARDVFVGLPSSKEFQARLICQIRAENLRRKQIKSLNKKIRNNRAKLVSTRDLLNRVIDANPDPVVCTNPRGKMIVFNHAAEIALGYNSEYAQMHMHVTEVYADPADARRVLAEIRSAPNGMLVNFPVNLRIRSGDLIPVRLFATEVLDASGIPMATIGVFRDQRDELSLRQQLEKTTEQLILTERRAEAFGLSNAAAHELNQPLTALMGSIELLDIRTDLPDDVRQRHGKMYQQLERMSAIIRDLSSTIASPLPRHWL